MNNVTLEFAINDFILGRGTDIPSQEVCEILVNNHSIINSFIKDALNKGLKNISIMPYGEKIQCWENPTFYGNCSKTINILDKNDKDKVLLEVNFDRN